MSRITRFLIAAIVLLSAVRAQEIEISKLEGGLEVHATYVKDNTGARLRHGAYRVVSSAGHLLVEGNYSNGRRDGGWTYRLRDGASHARGAYADNTRDGEWTLYIGSPAVVFAKGRFVGGVPTKSWKIMARGEQSGPSFTGRVERIMGALASGATYEGYLFDGNVHGPWRLTWSDGSPLLVAHYDMGRPISIHTFALPGGVETFGMGSSIHGTNWLDGRSAYHPLMFEDLDELGSARAREVAAPKPLIEVLRTLAPPDARPNSLFAESVAVMAQDIVAAEEGTAFAAAARARLAAHGPEVGAWWALAELQRIDWEVEADVLRARTIVQRLLLPFVPGTEGEWDWSRGPGASDRNRAAWLRAYGHYWVTGYTGDHSGLDSSLRARSESVTSPYERLVGWVLPIEEWGAGQDGREWTVRRAEERAGTPFRRRGGSVEVERQALRNAVAWLLRNQTPDGGWRSDHVNQSGGKVGEVGHDVGVTGLALLAILRAGEAVVDGRVRNDFVKGLDWLIRQQRADGLIAAHYQGVAPDGQLVSFISSEFIYGHAIATLLLAEVTQEFESSRVRTVAQSAVDYLVKARNPYGAWRYRVPPIGDTDTSVTGWAVCALAAARSARLEFDAECFIGARNWFQEVTDPSTGRCGYDRIGGVSSRYAGRNENYPPANGEAMTAIAQYCRFLMGGRPEEDPEMRKHAELLRRCLPDWNPSVRSNDMYYWYFGTCAMHQMGGDYWESWNKTVKPALFTSQIQDGAEQGSWDPIGPWGCAGGRVYATSICALTHLADRQERTAVSVKPVEARSGRKK